jgi:hypothetical protein
MTLEQHLAVLGIAAMIVSGLYVFTPVNDRIFLSGAVAAAALAMLSLYNLLP